MRVRIIALLFLIYAAPFANAQDFQTTATHAVILDYETGEILFDQNGGVPMPPASMSKLMTILMAFEAIDRGALSLDDELPVSEYAWRTGGAASGSSTMFLEVNSRARVEDLLRGIIIQSGNDACIVIAEALSGSEAAFAADMTARARELGLTSASFANSTGWPDPGQQISAADLARIAAIIIRDHPELYELFAEREFTYNGIRQFNRNPLLSTVDGVDGLKTGHTQESGYGLVASGVRNGTRRIVVYNGMESERARANEGERLMRAALTDFDVIDLAEAGDVVGEAEVFLGQAETVALRLNSDVRLGLHVNARDDIEAVVVYDGPLPSPISEGDVIAMLEVSAPGVETRRYELEAAEDVDRQGLMGRALAGLGSLFGFN
ncbi:D-alanyl-D-alanine carboxypeptidase family protein [Hyphobacterium sp. HN65]|uniref:serine-type D-Ala-D-Ala carboxypeptidase n=1 Tax=Hyphobacterium lacteum TaxID=3116575 RepID=A0ABU7LMW2_9PROT|nr:D-alanyl-D-alanine carboxypeptidase family protein [Hyphobacterium sp. HN65]MEE2524956.1 D-alanyl-D-alanine carboxypeptidase family protein [Hyphobacterium sp. HN65]